MPGSNISRLTHPASGIKAPVKAVAKNNITLSGLQTLQGYSLQEGDRVLTINQTTASEVGIYVASANEWARAKDWNGDGEVTSGVLIMNEADGLGYQATFTGAFVIGTTAPTFRSVFGLTSNYSEYAPGYVYTYQSDTVFRVQNHDVTNIFRVGRRLKFQDGPNVYYGSVASRTFSTHTDVTMTMEDGAVLPNSATVEIFMVSGEVAWSPIGANPFESDPIYAVASGRIGLVTYWVIVGANGRLSYSTDKGVTWTNVATGTTQTLRGVAFDRTNKRFMAVGNAGVMLTSTNGVDWTLDTTTLPAFVSGGTADVSSVQYNFFEDAFWIAINFDGLWDYAHSTDFGSTWTGHATGHTNFTNIKIGRNFTDDRASMIVNGFGSLSAIFNNIADALPTSGIASLGGGNHTNGVIFYTIGQVSLDFMSGNVAGRIGANITGTINSLDDVTFGNAIRAFAYSSFDGRLVLVGDAALVGYNDDVNINADATDAWTFVSTGFDITANVQDVDWSEDDRLFIAVADNGQICRSSTGLN